MPNSAAFARLTLENPDRTEAALELEPERENLRSAIEWALGAGQVETSLLLASAYGVLCTFHGPYGEGRLWLEAALQKAGKQFPGTRATALRTVSSIAVRQGDLDRARTSAEDWLTLVRRTGDATDVGVALRALGIIACDQGDYETSEALQREALEVFERTGNDREVEGVARHVGLGRDRPAGLSECSVGGSGSAHSFPRGRRLERHPGRPGQPWPRGDYAPRPAARSAPSPSKKPCHSRTTTSTSSTWPRRRPSLQLWP